ncbi:MAG: histidine--tRNA ligase [Candidatus Saccharibacteria bacterium]|nr:histidine--tRNA ligase [Candidatus Saccharibacteria bacterium]
MPTIKPRTPSGFPEYLPEEQLEFNRLLGIIRDTYERYGFSPIDTPDLELSEVLLTKSGGETEQEIYRFTKGSNDLTMRFDLTVPLARYAAQHEGQLIFPFRRYHIGKVHRGERAQAGRFREFYQCDIDVIGSNSTVVDAEFPAIINQIFTQFNFGDFTIRINNRKVLNGFFEGIGLGAVSKEVLRVIDKIEKITTDELVAELEKLGLSDTQVAQVQAFTAIAGDTNAVLSQLREVQCDSMQFTEGVDELTTLTNTLKQMGVPAHRFMIDLKIARGLDYYTGTVYETTLNDYPEVGSVCSGGRYDNLAEHYTRTKLPGVGISIGLSRLFYKLRELGVIRCVAVSPATIAVMPLANEQLPSAVEVAAILRSKNHNVLLYTEQNAIKKKFKYADKMGFAWVALIGEDEAASGEVTVKNMQTGESVRVAQGEVAAAVE